MSAAPGRQTQSDLSLSVSGAAAGRHHAGLRGSRHSRRAARSARLDDGTGSDPRDRRFRRRIGRPPADGRCARDALRDAQYCWDREQSALRRQADDPRSVGAHDKAVTWSSRRPWSRPSSPTICLRRWRRGDSRWSLAIFPQAVQKPSFTTFQVPSILAPALPKGSRVALPSGVNTMVYSEREGEEAMKGWPLKKVALMALPSSAAACAGETGAKTKAAAASGISHASKSSPIRRILMVGMIRQFRRRVSADRTTASTAGRGPAACGHP